MVQKASLSNQRNVIPTKSSKPHHSPKRIPESIVDAIVAKRLGKHPRCGAVIQRELANEGVRVSISTVNRVLDRAGLLKKKSKWKRFWRNTPRPAPDNPGDLIELDTIRFRPFWHRNNKTAWYVYAGLDVNSRTGFAQAVERISPGPSLHFARRIQVEAPFRIGCFQTDNGQEFGRYFSLNLGVRHRKIRKRKPSDNAHVEKFIRTLQEECLNKARFNTIEKLKQCLKEFIDYYNNRRLHMGINFQVPIQRLIAAGIVIQT